MKKYKFFAHDRYSLVSCWHLLLVSFFSVLVLCACGDETPQVPTPTENKAVFIKDEAKRQMIYSLLDLEVNKGRIYEMTYTTDYKLDAALKFGITCTESLQQFVALNLYDSIPSYKSQLLSYDAGCSAFACPNKNGGEFLMGRNFDFNHKDSVTKERIMIPLIVVHTAPEGGKKSVSFVDGQFVGYESGFFTDTTSDLSMLVAVPYLMLDGINEDGFAVSVLKLDGKPTRQTDPTKTNIFTTVAMRMLLDRASTVKEACAMLENYNMWMDKYEKASYHFFMADATGDYAIVEYTNPKLDDDEYPNRMEVLTGVDTLRYVTNFYVSPTMEDTDHGFKHSDHGKDRYMHLRDTLMAHHYEMTPEEAMCLLDTVSQGPEVKLSTGFTQWSEIYNLTKRSVTMSILREYDRTFVFGIE